MEENALQKQVLIYHDEELTFPYWKQTPLNYQRTFVVKMLLQRGKTFEGATDIVKNLDPDLLFCLVWNGSSRV